MNDCDFEKIDAEIEMRTAKDAGLVWEYDRWVEPEYEDIEFIEFAKTQRANEIANFGKDIVESAALDWNPQIELLDIRPEQFEWISIGEYNDIDIPGVQIGGFYTAFDNANSLAIIEADYRMWQQLPAPEYDCEVIIQ